MAVADRDSPRGWLLEDIEAQREQIPDEENAALVVARVKSLLPANWPAPLEKTEHQGEPGTPLNWEERLHELSPELQLEPWVLRGLEANLAKAELARVEARKLVGMTHGRFPIKWQDNVFMTTLTSQDARSAANLLHYEAALAAQHGDADRAMVSVRGLVATARSIGDEPLLISVLIRVACDAVAVAA